MTQPLPPLCAPCVAERDRWLDTTPNRLIPRPGFAHGSGAAYDSSPAGVRDGRSARYKEWADTVNYQRDLIATACRNGQHAPDRRTDMDLPPDPWPGTPPGPPPPPPPPPPND